MYKLSPGTKTPDEYQAAYFTKRSGTAIAPVLVLASARHGASRRQRRALADRASGPRPGGGCGHSVSHPGECHCPGHPRPPASTKGVAFGVIGATTHSQSLAGPRRRFWIWAYDTPPDEPRSCGAATAASRVLKSGVRRVWACRTMHYKAAILLPDY